MTIKDAEVKLFTICKAEGFAAQVNADRFPFSVTFMPENEAEKDQTMIEDMAERNEISSRTGYFKIIIADFKEFYRFDGDLLIAGDILQKMKNGTKNLYLAILEQNQKERMMRR